MSTALLVGDVIQVKCYASFQQQGSINVLHYICGATTGGTVTDVAVAQQLEATFAPLYKAWLPTVCIWEGVRVQRIHPGITPVAVVNTANKGAGTVLGDPLPGLVAGVVTKRTALAGRKGRGRMFLPFFSEGASGVDAKPGAVVKAAMQAFANAALTTINVVSGGANMPLTPTLFRKSGAVATPVTGNLVRDDWYRAGRRGSGNKPDRIGPVP